MDTKHFAINEDELSAITLGSGFGGITDIEKGPDSSLYVSSDDDIIGGANDDGIICEISSNGTTSSNTVLDSCIPTTMP